MPLLRENNFVPVLADIPKKVAKEAKILYINYPNNPTAAIAPPGFYREVVDFATEHDIVVVSDNAYSEIAYDGYRAPSFLETKGAMDVGIEMHSLSKTYNMTGCGSAWQSGTPRSFPWPGQDECGLRGIQRSPARGDCCPQRPAGLRGRCLHNLPGTPRRAGQRAAEPRVRSSRPESHVLCLAAGEDCMAFSARLLNEAGIVATPVWASAPAGKVMSGLRSPDLLNGSGRQLSGCGEWTCEACCPPHH